MKTADQLTEVLGLLQQLLPPLQDSTSYIQAQAQATTPAGASAAASPGTSPSAAARAKGDELQSFYTDSAGPGPGLLRRFSSELLPLVLALHGGTAHPSARLACLGAVTRILHFCPSAQLEEDLRDLPVCTLVQSLLLARDAASQVRAHCTQLMNHRMLCSPGTRLGDALFHMTFCSDAQTPCLKRVFSFDASRSSQAAGLHLAEILLAKLPAVYTPLFVREGVVHSVASLANGGSAAPHGGSPDTANANSTQEPARGKLFATT